MKTWQLYLSGEIHSDWREQLYAAAKAAQLPISFSGPVTDHDASDNVGDELLGREAKAFWKDHKAAKINAIRSRTLLSEADVVVVRFGDKYKQWNAAFDAGFAAALNKPLIVMHSDEHQHALKEVDASALAVVETPQQVIDIMTYVIKKQ